MNIKKILCPTDFSKPSERVLTEAIGLAKTLGAAVKVVHVFQRPVSVSLESAPVTMEAAEKYIAETQAEMRKHLEETKQRHAADGVAIEVELIEGAPYAAIVEQGKSCDMIVMPTHGRTGFQHFVLGSVAERVVRTATCPVLTVPMTEAEKENG